MTDINRISGNKIQTGQTNAGQSKSAANLARRKELENTWKAAADAVVKGEKTADSGFKFPAGNQQTGKSNQSILERFKATPFQGHGFAAPFMTPLISTTVGGLMAQLAARNSMPSATASTSDQGKGLSKPVFGAPQSVFGLTDSGLDNLRNYAQGGTGLAASL